MATTNSRGDVAVDGGDKAVIVWNADERGQPKRIPQAGVVHGIQLSEDGQYACIADHQRVIRDISGVPTKVFQVDSSTRDVRNDIYLSPDSQMAVLYSSFGKIEFLARISHRPD